MLRRIAAFFGKVIRTKWFRILFRVVIAYLILSCLSAVGQLTRIGIPFRSALKYVIRSRLGLGNLSLPVASIGLGIIFGVLWYRRYRKKPENEEEKIAEKPAEPPEEKQEEEIIETQHYRFH